MKKFKIARIIFCLWLLVWPWQTKLIIRPAASAYSEISLFGSFLILLTPVIIWGGQLILSEYQKIRTAKRITLSWSLGLVILETIAVLSLIWATDKALAFYRLLFLTSGLVILNAVSQPYFIKKKNFIGFFVAGLILPACLAVGQFLWQQAPAVKYFGLASHTATVLGDSVVEVSGRRYLRAYGPFDHPNILGGVMVLGLMAAISGLFFLSYRLRDKVFYLVASGLFYTALFFSFSRTAWLALIVGVLLCLWVYGRRRLLRPNIFIILLLFFGLTFALFIPERSLVFSRTQTENRLENKSITERELYWQQADAVIKNDGAFGVGLGNYVPAIQRLFPGHPVWYYQPVHNYWLLILAELGFVGFLGVAIIWYGLARCSWRNKTYPLLAVLFVLSLFDHWFWTQPSALVIIFLFLGQAAASYPEQLKIKKERV